MTEESLSEDIENEECKYSPNVLPAVDESQMDSSNGSLLINPDLVKDLQQNAAVQVIELQEEEKRQEPQQRQFLAFKSLAERS